MKMLMGLIVHEVDMEKSIQSANGISCVSFHFLLNFSMM